MYIFFYSLFIFEKYQEIFNNVYFPSLKGVVAHYLTKLNSLQLNMLCTKFGWMKWNWRRSRKCKFIDRQQTNRHRTDWHWTKNNQIKPKWAFSLCELKSYLLPIKWCNNYIKIIARMIANIITHIPTAFPDKKRYQKRRLCLIWKRRRNIYNSARQNYRFFAKKRELKYICIQTRWGCFKNQEKKQDNFIFRYLTNGNDGNHLLSECWWFHIIP